MQHKTIARAFMDNARSYETGTIIMYKKEKGGQYVNLTWNGLRDSAFAFACGLVDLGMEPGDRLAILSSNRLEWIITDLGCMLAGGVNVSIYHTNTPDQCAYIIKDAGARFAVVEDSDQLAKILSKKQDLESLEKIVLVQGNCPDGSDGVISFDALLKSGEAAKGRLEEEIHRRIDLIELEDMASIVYTSGTTGPPKGCMISHKNLSVVLDAIQQLHRMDSKTDLSLMFLPLSHLYPRVSGYYSNIYLNVPMAIAESIDTLVQNMAEVRPTYFAGVPRVFEKVYARVSSVAETAPPMKRRLFQWSMQVGRERSRKLNDHQPLSPMLKLKFAIADKLVFRRIRDTLGGRLRFAVSAGAPLSAEVGESIHSMGIQVLEFYALTETISGAMTTFEHCRFGTVGKPMPGVEVQLASDGEILIRGNNFMGYYNQPELTAEVMKDGWCLTGDVGRWDEDGFLVITDRKKDLIITSGGKNISPQNIENLFKGIPLISNVMVYGDAKKYLTALITLNQTDAEALARRKGISYETFEELTRSPQLREEIQGEVDRINANLAKYETIKKFVVLPHELSQEAGEITPTLKLRRKVLREKYGHLLDSLYDDY